MNPALTHTSLCLAGNEGCPTSHHGYHCICAGLPEPSKTNAECTNCQRRFTIDKVVGVNYSCGVCDTGLELEFDTDKEDRLRREKEQQEFEFNHQMIVTTLSDAHVIVQGPRIKVNAIMDLIAKHGLP